jgi:diguanylate cyclase (GGDEF)-like protein
VTERKQLEEQLTHRAFHDPLTELPNRALFLDRIAHAIATQKRTNDRLAVMFVDLDDFKTVNDGLGHAAGDLVLIAVAERLRSCLRVGDTCARLGGDEFGILLEGLDDPSEAYDVGSRILEVLSDPIPTPEGVTSLNASLGIVLSTDTDADPAALVRNADLAMYQAKGDGKGRYSVFEVGMHQAVVERLALKADLRTAIARREFAVHYQSMVDLTTGAVVGAEALVRWQHPTRGLLAPADFLPVAEETGLISGIGSHVLARACADAVSWPRPDGRQLRVSVNLSASQLRDESVVDEVASVLAATGLDPAALTLEITETLLMEDPDRAAEVIRQLKSLGVKIALDDFGTGFSSLSYLSRFPVDSLKIDKSFVDALAGAGAANDASLVRAITGLGEMLRLQVTAEGIERHSQLAELIALGCQFGQGFHFARPVPDEEFVAVLTNLAADPRGVRPS